ncbi:hypothetical protein Syun_023821 [Stephania yunnanensis]|uniref:Uncharacterized protein n=1 Tax=Stephania yunnanensis TaxID=152371 RepID=A0AAP0FDB3_9MAGN
MIPLVSLVSLVSPSLWSLRLVAVVSVIGYQLSLSGLSVSCLVTALRSLIGKISTAPTLCVKSEGTAKWLLDEIARRETDAERSLMHREFYGHDADVCVSRYTYIQRKIEKSVLMNKLNMHFPLPPVSTQEEVSSLQSRFAFGAGIDLDLLGIEIDKKALIPGLAELQILSHAFEWFAYVTEIEIDGNLYYKCAACRGDCYQVQDDSDAVQELWRRRDKADK